MQGIEGQGLYFFPLYWIAHDQWRYHTGWPNYITYHHHGHQHLFLLGFPWASTSGDAFSGTQNFSFEIQDVWGPRSDDPNQMLPYRVVGTPKWYWRIVEVWRRMYIQRWDEHVETDSSTIVGRRGIRWDASPDDKVNGPFREGQGYAPAWFPNGGRTLPVEYYKNDKKLQLQRDNYVFDKAKAMIEEWNNDPVSDTIGKKTFVEEKFNLDHGNYLDPGHAAAVDTFPDSLYIHPIIEYQKVVQLDWERMPGWAARHDRSPDDFGDGWSNSITLPFINPSTGTYNSPFSSKPGEVHPIGEYFGTYLGANTDRVGPLVPLAARLKNRKRDDGPPTSNNPKGGYDYGWEPFGLPAFGCEGSKFPGLEDYRENESEQLVKFKNPYDQDKDGRWVQQFIGGSVEVRCEVTIEHRLGGRSTVWVTDTQLVPDTKFAGTDQMLPG